MDTEFSTGTKCPYCGHLNEYSGARFCPACGKRLGEKPSILESVSDELIHPIPVVEQPETAIEQPTPVVELPETAIEQTQSGEQALFVAPAQADEEQSAPVRYGTADTESVSAPSDENPLSAFFFPTPEPPQNTYEALLVRRPSTQPAPSAPTAQSTTRAQAPTPSSPTAAQPKRTVPRDTSEFTAGAFSYFFVGLAVVLGSVITLGIAMPWLVCWQNRWISSHTYINGKQMCFDGTGLQLLGSVLKWTLLTIITFGIYGLWMILNFKRWFTKHTHFEGEIEQTSRFDGRLIGFIGTMILSGILTLITLGIGSYWAFCIIQRWYTKHTVIDGYRLDFDGKGLEYLGKNIVWSIFTILTFGIYSFWFAVNQQKWIVSHTLIESVE